MRSGERERERELFSKTQRQIDFGGSRLQGPIFRICYHGKSLLLLDWDVLKLDWKKKKKIVKLKG